MSNEQRIEDDHRRFEDAMGESLTEAKVRLGVLEGYRTNHLREHERIQAEIDKAKEAIASIKAGRALP